MEYQHCPLSQCTDIMVDIETTGLRPDRHAMIQLAAMPFKLSPTGEMLIGDTYFDMCLKLPNSRGWLESTRDWWYSKNSHILADIITRGQDPKFVMENFAGFLQQMSGQVKFWCKRSFDWQFVESYFHDYEVTNPLRYQNVHEMMSYLKGMSYPAEPPKVPVNISKEGSFAAHNAHYDVLFQIHLLFNTIKHLKG